MSHTLEDLAITVANAVEMATALNVPFEVKMDFPEIKISEVEPLEVYLHQVRSQRMDFDNGEMTIMVRVHSEDWLVVVPKCLHSITFHNLGTPKGDTLLPLDLRKLITTHILENS